MFLNKQRDFLQSQGHYLLVRAADMGNLIKVKDALGLVDARKVG